MRRRDFITSALASLAAATAIAGVVEAGMKAGPNMAGPGHHRLKVPSGAALDGFTAPSGAYSFRKLLSSYNGPAIRIRRTSDNAEVDIGFLGFVPGLGAPWDEAAAVAHCAATTCWGRTWYDQSGGTRNIIQTTAANQVQLVFNCNGGLPCWQTTAAQSLSSSPTQYTPVSPVSFSAVANRSAGTGVCSWPVQFNVNSLTSTGAVANQWRLFAGTGVPATAADNAWHAAQGVINGASSVLRIDGAETAGTATVGTALGSFVGFWGAASTTCKASEVIAWDAYALTPAERAALGANQKSYWGTP